MKTATRQIFPVGLTLALLLFLVPLVATQPSASGPVAASGVDPAGLLKNQPITFIQNHGQWDERVSFLARKGRMTAWFHADGWSVDYAASSEAVGDREVKGPGPCTGRPEIGSARQKGVVVRMTFEGSQGLPPEGRARIPGYFNFFLGNQPPRWATRVPAFQQLSYPAIYPGIDLSVREQDGHLEYDVCLEPGARLEQVVVCCEGIDRLAIDADGTLVMKTRYATLRQAAPRTWYVCPSGKRSPVPCRYRILDASRYGFEVPRPRDGVLVIDPGLEWSTFLGGTDRENAHDLVVDATGLVTVVSETRSTNFPTTTGAYDTTFNGIADIAVSQFDPTQKGIKQLVWSTFLGGSNDDRSKAIALDSSGSFTVTSSTSSTDFPTTTGAYRSTQPGNNSGAVARLNATGSILLYATYIGGTFNDWLNTNRPVVDKNGVITLAGGTWSTDFPTTSNAYRRTHFGSDDGFIARLDPRLKGLNQLVYSTFIGGSGRDGARQVVVDAAGLLTVGGWTSSWNFPTTANAFPFRGGPSPGPYDGFVARLDLTKSGSAQLVWSTCFGGTGPGTKGAPSGDVVNGVALTRSGLVAITGCTDSLDLPVTANAFDTTYNGGGTTNRGGDAYLAYLDPSKPPNKSVVYCTFLGGSGTTGDGAWGVAVDSADTATVSGWTDSSDFPVTPGAFPSPFGMATSHAFVTRIHRAPTLLYSSHFGGSSGWTGCWGLAIDQTGAAAVAGSTNELKFPTTPSAYQTAYAGGQYDGTVVRIDMLPTGVRKYGTSTASCQGPIFMLVNRMPVSPTPQFAFSGTNAPPVTSGYLVIGFVPFGIWIPNYNFMLLVAPPAVPLPVITDGAGHVVTPVPIPPGLKGIRVYCQYLFNNTGNCGPLGTVSASNALEVIMQ